MVRFLGAWRDVLFIFLDGICRCDISRTADAVYTALWLFTLYKRAMRRRGHLTARRVASYVRGMVVLTFIWCGNRIFTRGGMPLPLYPW